MGETVYIYISAKVWCGRVGGGGREVMRSVYKTVTENYERYSVNI
jgi:hypothetical protein